MGFPCSSVGKESACSAGDPGLIPGSERSPGEGNGNSLQYPCLENLMDRRAWWAAVHGVCKESGMTRQLTLTYLLVWTYSTLRCQICICKFLSPLIYIERSFFFFNKLVLMNHQFAATSNNNFWIIVKDFHEVPRDPCMKTQKYKKLMLKAISVIKSVI